MTLRAAARSLLEAAGAPPEALDLLIQGVIDTGFELTGPIARGDWEMVERHLDVIRAQRPELEGLYLALAEAIPRVAGRDPHEVPACGPCAPSPSCGSLEPLRSGLIACADDGCAARANSSLLDAAHTECDTVVMSLFVNPRSS